MEFTELNLRRAINEYATLKMSARQFYALMVKDSEFFIKNRSKINSAEVLRHKIISERKLEVLYISGASGSGKTTAAKYYAGKLNYDYFISGSGDDILDGYDKEECIILDDFRGGSMKFSELLKLLDNNTNSSVRSRYNNKDISNCKLLIMTSIHSPKELYKSISEKEDNSEPIEQLYRRLKHRYFKVENDEICEYKLTVDDISATGRSLGSISNIYKDLGINPSEVDKTSVLDGFMRDGVVQMTMCSKEEEDMLKDVF